VAVSLQMAAAVAVAGYVHQDVRWRDFAPLAGLFTRIRREKLLEHPVRELIYTEIRSNPGIHYRELLRKLGMPNGSLAFHFHHLERAGYIRSRRARGRRHLFSTELLPSTDSFLVTDRQRRILEFLRSRPGASERLIVKSLGMSRSNVSYHIGVLRSLGLVRTRRVGGRTLCYVPGS
jgi:predicted transcriptional regulator